MELMAPLREFPYLRLLANIVLGHCAVDATHVMITIQIVLDEKLLPATDREAHLGRLNDPGLTVGATVK